MNLVAAFVNNRTGVAWAFAAAAALAGALLVGLFVRDRGEADRLARLRIEASQKAVEIVSQTLNGDVMGSLALLATIDDDLRRDALGLQPPNEARIFSRLEIVAGLYGAQGVFVVGRNGLVASSWDSSGRPSTGIDVGFRPYYRVARQGRANIYAAVSLARGDRALYFATPIFMEDRGSEAVGAVVARTDLGRIVALLKSRADSALLLSPQGVVFAGSRAEWVGMLSGVVTPERVGAIREQKQFGALFDKSQPTSLPFDVNDGVVTLDGRRHALATAEVTWNDPNGAWTLVLLEDLSRTVPNWQWLSAALAAGAATFVMAALILRLLVARHLRDLDRRRIEDYAAAQEASARRSNQRAEVALTLQGAKTVSDIASTFLAEAHRIFGAQQGCMYVSDEDGVMRLGATYAMAGSVSEVVRPGDGLLGQCLAENRSRLLTLADTQPWAIRSGLGEASPTAVLISPLTLDEKQLGLIEIGLPAVPDSEQQALFAELASLTAFNIAIRLGSTAVHPRP